MCKTFAKSVTVAPICVSSGGKGGGRKEGVKYNRRGRGGPARRDDKLTARDTLSKHSLSYNNQLAGSSCGGGGNGTR